MSYVTLIINNKYKTNQFNIKVRMMFLQSFFHKKKTGSVKKAGLSSTYENQYPDY
mgnify:CR=1 FL=1